MKKLILFLVMVSMIVYGVFGGDKSEYKKAPDTIYINGTIITMNDKQKFAESFAVKGDQISAVGDVEDIKKLASNKTNIVGDMRSMWGRCEFDVRSM